jgi:hypothetical protein
MGEYSKVKSPYDGGTFTNPGMVDLIRTYCKIRGYPSVKSITVIQGSFTDLVPESMHTHSKADALDLSEFDAKTKDKIFRSIGGAIWHRAAGFKTRHCHLARMYSTKMFSLTAAQERAYRAHGSDGLGDLSHKDTEWQPRYRGVKHLSGPEPGQWIARTPTPGYSVAGTDPVNDKDLIKVKREKGFVLSGIAGQVRSQGKTYLVATKGKDDMTFYLRSDFSRFVPNFVALAQTMVTTKGGVHGREAPGLAGVPDKAGIKIRPKGFHIKVTGFVKTSEGVFWSSNHGTWYAGASLKVLGAPATIVPPPPPPVVVTPVPLKAAAAKPAALMGAVPTSHAMTLISQNEIALRLTPKNTKHVGDWKHGKGYATRCGLMTELYRDSGVSVVAGAEAAGLPEMRTFNKALTKALGSKWESHLFGDGFDISQSINVDTAIFEVVDLGFVTMTPAGPGNSHNIAPWALLRHRDSGIAHYEVSLHLIAGSGKATSRHREAQIHTLVPQLDHIAGGLPVIYAGDMNDARGQAFDGVGKAFTSFDYTDVEATDCEAINPEWPSYNDLKAKPHKSGLQLDRCFIRTSQVTARRRKVLVPLENGKISVPKGWPSDHWAVLYDLTVRSV